MAQTVYLSLGSNLGDRLANLRQATARLQELGTVILRSSIYETQPVDVEDQQPDYLNCVLVMKTDLEPEDFLKRVLALEHAMGRQRTGRKTARNIDIDVLLFGDLIITSDTLTVPHPAMHQRRFVLEPLAEIAPDAIHPVLKRTVRELCNALPASSGAVKKIS